MVKLLLVEPLAHIPGYFEEYVRCLSQPLAAGGMDVSLLTFDGLVTGAWPAEGVRHTSFVERTGRTGRACRFLPRLMPIKAIRQVLGEVLATACALALALRMSRKESFDIVHVPGVALPELFYPLFALLQRRGNIVYGLWIHSREEDVRDWATRFSDAARHLEMVRCLRLLAGIVVAGRPGIAATNWLYGRAMKMNRLTFICNYPAVMVTYARAPFRERIFLIPMAVYAPPGAPVSREEARRHLGLPDGQLVLLHFGTNHSYKDFPTVFAAL